MSTITYAAWSFTAGALIPLMAILNGGLARATGGTIQATVILFATGLIASLVLAATMKAHIPAIQTLARIALPQYGGRLNSGMLYLEHYVSRGTFWCRQCDSIRRHVTSAWIPLRLRGSHSAPLATLRAEGLFVVVIGVVITQVSDRITAGAR